MGTASNLKKNLLTVTRVYLSLHRGLEQAIDLMETLPEGAVKNSAITAICEHLSSLGNASRAAGFVGQMTPGADKDIVISSLMACDLGTQSVYSLLTGMSAGSARDQLVTAFIERCRNSNEKNYFLSTAALYNDAEMQTCFYEGLLSSSLDECDVEMAVRTYAALNRKPCKREQDTLLAAAWTSGDLRWVLEACALCGREAPTDKEKGALVGAAVKKAKIATALEIAKNMTAGAEKTTACWQIINAFGSNAGGPVVNTNETLETVLVLPASERPAAYEKMMAVCVKNGMYGVAYRVAEARGQKLTNAEILVMLNVCRECRGVANNHLGLAKCLEDGPEKTAAIEAMIPDLIRTGEIEVVKEAAYLSGRVLLRSEVEELVRVVRYRGVMVVVEALALLDVELSQEEVYALLTT